MGVSGRRNVIALLFIIAAIAGTIYFISSKKQAGILQPDDIEFADVYTDMALARESAGNNTVRLDSLYFEIYERHGIDSAWLINYANAVSYDAERQKKIWDYIVEKLDSLKTAPESGSSLNQ
jgi:hypothetical protein